MKILDVLKDNTLTLYVLSFLTGTSIYTANLLIDDNSHPGAKEVVFIYIILTYLFLVGYIILKHYLKNETKADIYQENQQPKVIITLNEVKALVRYAATHGIDKEKSADESQETTTVGINKSVINEKNSVLSELSQLITEWEKVEASLGELSAIQMTRIVLLYKELNLLTPENVTGKTLCDSLKVDAITRPIRQITWYVVFPLILLNVFLDGWFEDIAEPEEGYLYYLLCFQRYVLDYINPFLWGALGSCIYLLKVFSDLAENNIFNEDKMQGWGTRITLGAILGGVIQFIYDESAFGDSGINLDANAIGFLTGIGVKVVYGSLEKTIEKLSSFMNLESIKKAKTDNNEIRRYLNEKISTLGESEDDKSKRAAFQELLDNLNKRNLDS